MWKTIKKAARGAVLLVLIFPVQVVVIMSIEKTIQANDMDLDNAPLVATSQLIPFLVGIFSTVSVFWISLRPHISTRGTRL
jgi:hypothetical protein